MEALIFDSQTSELICIDVMHEPPRVGECIDLVIGDAYFEQWIVKAVREAIDLDGPILLVSVSPA